MSDQSAGEQIQFVHQWACIRKAPSCPTRFASPSSLAPALRPDPTARHKRELILLRQAAKLRLQLYQLMRAGSLANWL